MEEMKHAFIKKNNQQWSPTYPMMINITCIHVEFGCSLSIAYSGVFIGTIKDPDPEVALYQNHQLSITKQNHEREQTRYSRIPNKWTRSLTIQGESHTTIYIIKFSIFLCSTIVYHISISFIQQCYIKHIYIHLYYICYCGSNKREIQ